MIFPNLYGSIEWGNFEGLSFPYCFLQHGINSKCTLNNC